MKLCNIIIILIMCVALVFIGSMGVYKEFTNGKIYDAILMLFIYMVFCSFFISTIMSNVNYECEEVKEEVKEVIKPTFKIGDKIKILFHGEAEVSKTYETIDRFLIIYNNRHCYVNSKGQLEKRIYSDLTFANEKKLITPYSIIATEKETFYDIKIGDSVTYIKNFSKINSKVIETNLVKRTFTLENGKEFNLEGIEMNPIELDEISIIYKKEFA